MASPTLLVISYLELTCAIWVQGVGRGDQNAYAYIRGHSPTQPIIQLEGTQSVPHLVEVVEQLERRLAHAARRLAHLVVPLGRVVGQQAEDHAEHGAEQDHAARRAHHARAVGLGWVVRVG